MFFIVGPEISPCVVDRPNRLSIRRIVTNLESRRVVL